MNYGKQLLKILREQRNTFERLNNGSRRIFDPIGYNKFEEESLRLQKLIGRENKKKLINERIYVKGKIV